MIYGNLRVLKIVLEKNNQGKSLSRAYCLCKCGNKKNAWLKDIRYGTTRSCGCLVKYNHKKTHGLSDSKTWSSWMNMKRRCDAINTPFYKNYGGRGITYCKRWAKFENFYKDMGERPPKMSLDRINNNKNYCLKNCRWATYKEQRSNTRKNVFVTFRGETTTFQQLADKYKIDRDTLHSRIKRKGMSLEEALFTPVKHPHGSS